MFRTIVLPLLACTLLPTWAAAQDWARERLDNSPRHLEWVAAKHDDRKVNCFLAFPEVSKKATAVIVIHEIFGLSDWVRGMTDQLAEAGYIAIAPDLLSGMAPNGGGTNEFSTDDVRRAVSSLDSDQITADLNAVFQYVAKLPACNGKVVVAGFCWGGRQSFRYATNNNGLEAAFVFYGTGPEQAAEVETITCPVYGFYGENDARVNATIPDTTDWMKAKDKSYDPVKYEGAGHGFMRAGEAPDASPENRQGRADAWERWKKLLADI